MWKRELELGDEELFDVGTTNVVRLFELDDAENLFVVHEHHASTRSRGTQHVRESTGNEHGV